MENVVENVIPKGVQPAKLIIDGKGKIGHRSPRTQKGHEGKVTHQLIITNRDIVIENKWTVKCIGVHQEGK